MIMIKKYSHIVYFIPFFIIFINNIVLGIKSKDSIIFLSNREKTNGEYDIFSLDLNTNELINLTKDNNHITIRTNSSPRLNYLRNSIIFLSFNPTSLMELNIKTREIEKITEINYQATNIQIAPSGNAVLYTEKIEQRLQLFEVNLISKEKINLSDNRFNNFEGVYSRDGKEIAFVTDEDGSNSIGIMSIDGSNKKLLTNSLGDDRYPNFSSDNTTIIFSSSRSGVKESYYDLFIVNKNNLKIEFFYQNNSYSTRPVFSANNEFVVFVSNARGQHYKDIFIIDTTNKNIIPITTHLKNIINGNFIVSENSDYIIYESINPPNSEVMMYNIKTNQTINLTNHKSWDCSPAF